MQILIRYQMQVGHMERVVRSPLLALEVSLELGSAGASHVNFADEAGRALTRDDLTALASVSIRG